MADEDDTPEQIAAYLDGAQTALRAQFGQDGLAFANQGHLQQLWSAAPPANADDLYLTVQVLRNEKKDKEALKRFIDRGTLAGAVFEVVAILGKNPFEGEWYQVLLLSLALIFALASLAFLWGKWGSDRYEDKATKVKLTGAALFFLMVAAVADWKLKPWDWF